MRKMTIDPKPPSEVVALKTTFHRLIPTVLTFVFLVYLASALVVLDLRAPAYVFDEEHDPGRNRPVAIGPRPRAVFYAPTYHGFFFVGDEWPFKVYAPVCWVWRFVLGYSAPSPRQSSS